MANAVSLTQELRDEYERLFASARIRPERLAAVDAVVDRIMKPANWSRYVKVSSQTNVPAVVIALIHNMECSLSFNGHLHNGDPLTAKTVHVPAKRPASGSPPFTWEDSAVDALKFDGMAAKSDWSLAGIAYALEGFNGFGYRRNHPQVKSPYLWSFTTIYSAGKYVADGKWSDTAVSQQCGALAILRRMLDRGDNIGFTPPAAPAPLVETEVDGVSDGPKAVADDGFTLRDPSTAPKYPGRAIGEGQKSEDVRAIQQRLKDLGYSLIGLPDADFGPKTASAVRLFQARSVDESGNPLKSDGIVGRLTWAALFGGIEEPAPDPAADGGDLGLAAVKVALGEVGVTEVPPGSNRGPKVNLYLSSIDPALVGNPWCMAFVYWCFGEASKAAGQVNPVPQSASVHRNWERAQKLPGVRVLKAAEAAADPSKVMKGMVFYIDTGHDHGHAGLVVDVVDGRLVTVEGNTNAGGSREGIGVFQRASRSVASINLGFVDFG